MKIALEGEPRIDYIIYKAEQLRTVVSRPIEPFGDEGGELDTPTVKRLKRHGEFVLRSELNEVGEGEGADKMIKYGIR